ncbi:hypothetical protein L2E82_51113 [Cichorium intybus]|nr:hypothetical protein L2E82_51113 [Cichorium intybus]
MRERSIQNSISTSRGEESGRRICFCSLRPSWIVAKIGEEEKQNVIKGEVEILMLTNNEVFYNKTQIRCTICCKPKIALHFMV